MPRYGKRGARRSTFIRRKTARRSGKFSKRFAKAVKRVLLKTCEPKKRSQSIPQRVVRHNEPSLIHQLNHPGSMPSQGTGDNERISDQINTSGFRLRLIFGQYADRENVTWQLKVISVPKGSAYNYSQWYDNVTGNVMLDELNEDFVKIHKTYTFKTVLSPDSNNTEEFTFVKKIWIPYKKLLKFGPANAATTHNDGYDWWLLLTAYDAYGTLITDNLGYVLGNVALHYKDP